MGKLQKGLILIVMMFGHNYVLNQAQSVQTNIKQIHHINTAEFNWNMYSMASVISIVFIVPLGILYDRFSQPILLIGACSLLLGQILVAIFAPLQAGYAFQLLVSGRVFEGIGAEVLYMIQGNLASTWMGKLAGLIFILPQCGEIANAFGTPFLVSNYGFQQALYAGLVACVFSFIACLFLYFHLRKSAKVKKLKKLNNNIVVLDSFDTKERQQQLSGIQKKTNIHKIPSHDSQTTESLSDLKDDIRNSSDENSKATSNSVSFKMEKETSKEEHYSKKPSIMAAGKVFWMTIALCAINECLYFPFMDNATLHIQTRFSIKYSRSGLYLCVPFIAAIVITAIHGEYILHRFSRSKLMMICSLIPLFGHLMIYLIPNSEGSESIFIEILLILGLALFGMGLGSYYSVSFPAVGYAVPESIRGTAYACLCFCQTISMAVVPIISGVIIDSSKSEGDTKETAQGYKTSSLLFVFLSLIGLLIGVIIYRISDGSSFEYCQEDHQENEQEEIQKLPSGSNYLDTENNKQVIVHFG